MSMLEFALILIKPDAWARGLVQVIRDGLEKEDLFVSEIGTIKFDLFLIMDFYQWPKIDHPKEIGNYMCTEPLQVWIAEGDNAIIKALSFKNDLRAKYCDGPLKNFFHCPSSQAESKRQYELLISKGITMTKQKSKERTKNQVEAIVFKRLATGQSLFLMLKRTPERGGFWQPVTGNVEEGEAFESAALREVREELGITANIQLLDTGYSYEFTDNNLDQFERVFGVEVSVDQDVKLSLEHTEYCWVSKNDALNVYLKYPGNKEGLRCLCDMLVRGCREKGASYE
jgi:dihydroneopterin triphosphate diphosphatase